MKTLIARHKAGEHTGICSVRFAHPLVIEAALTLNCGSTRKVLIEATSNQVNQLGDYTGITPADFREFIFTIANRVGFTRERIILGDDHLGPNCQQQESTDAAMKKSIELVKEYVRAGFSKIHLDTSMSCAGDPILLTPEAVAERATVLCFAVESVATNCQREQLSYVVNTEIPAPGGGTSAIQSVHVTHVKDVVNTLCTYQKAFIAHGLTEALTRVIAIVVQSGVELDRNNTIHYQLQEAQPLAQWIEDAWMAYEAHSTDYQTRTAYWELVRDHFAVLEVGPALAFALCEAIFALTQIEQKLIVPEDRSGCLAVVEEMMLDESQCWRKYYRTGFNDLLLDIRYSLSNRIRYYWLHSRIKNSVETMMVNLEDVNTPLGMISQCLPKQFGHTRSEELLAIPHQLIMDKTYDVLRAYRYGYAEWERYMTNLFVRSGISFIDHSKVLAHIDNEMLAKGVVYDTWPQALITRGAEFPTGIMLERYAIAIPHCEAIHTKLPTIYLLRPTNKVHFQQTDDDNDVAISLAIALVVKNPQQQLKLLCCLFGKL